MCNAAVCTTDLINLTICEENEEDREESIENALVEVSSSGWVRGRGKDIEEAIEAHQIDFFLYHLGATKLK